MTLPQSQQPSQNFRKYSREPTTGSEFSWADDDSGHVVLIKRALRRASIDCGVDVVHNFVEAINYLFGVANFADRQPTAMPDLIFLDLNMPEMNGRQVLQVLRSARHQDRVNLPPFVVTACDKDTYINNSYNLGAQTKLHSQAG
jgi:CheY-like chemotaxis protein